MNRRNLIKLTAATSCAALTSGFTKPKTIKNVDFHNKSRIKLFPFQQEVVDIFNNTNRDIFCIWPRGSSKSFLLDFLSDVLAYGSEFVYGKSYFSAQRSGGFMYSRDEKGNYTFFAGGVIQRLDHRENVDDPVRDVFIITPENEMECNILKGYIKNSKNPFVSKFNLYDVPLCDNNFDAIVPYDNTPLHDSFLINEAKRTMTQEQFEREIMTKDYYNRITS